MFRRLLNQGYPFNPETEPALTVDVPAVTVTPQPSRLARFVRRAWDVLIDTLDCIARYPYPPIELS